MSEFAGSGCLISEMHDQSDAQLLRAYPETANEAAFCELVARHTDLVYSAALRQVPSSDLARKAQALSQKLNADASLLGWLYRSTRYAALNRSAGVKTVAMTTFQKTFIVATLAAVAGTGIYQARQAACMRQQLQTLEWQQKPMAGQIRQLQQERDQAQTRASALSDELAALKSNSSLLICLTWRCHEGCHAGAVS